MTPIVKLQQSYVAEQYFVSTANRQSSAAIESPPYYYETIVWKRENDDWQHRIIYMHASGSLDRALYDHAMICRKLAYDEPLEHEGE